MLGLFGFQSNFAFPGGAFFFSVNRIFTSLPLCLIDCFYCLSLFRTKSTELMNAACKSECVNAWSRTTREQEF